METYNFQSLEQIDLVKELKSQKFLIYLLQKTTIASHFPGLKFAIQKSQELKSGG
jgi:hypothetical protein